MENHICIYFPHTQQQKENPRTNNYQPFSAPVTHFFPLTARALPKIYIPYGFSPAWRIFARLPFALLMCVCVFMYVCATPPTYHPLDYALLKMLIWPANRERRVCLRMDASKNRNVGFLFGRSARFPLSTSISSRRPRGGGGGRCVN